ncbi:hypothetical protein [Pseudonocardia spinosispora]|uniref:hypothetical protein n=1 Tax=Pseudonocardia spinosispora TaxID=103441 RepID=UPI000411C21A|nr:hypothetical protein [Pseudonocardia spinosispora]
MAGSSTIGAGELLVVAELLGEAARLGIVVRPGASLLLGEEVVERWGRADAPSGRSELGVGTGVVWTEPLDGALAPSWPMTCDTPGMPGAIRTGVGAMLLSGLGARETGAGCASEGLSDGDGTAVGTAAGTGSIGRCCCTGGRAATEGTTVACAAGGSGCWGSSTAVPAVPLARMLLSAARRLDVAMPASFGHISGPAAITARTPTATQPFRERRGRAGAATSGTRPLARSRRLRFSSLRRALDPSPDPPCMTAPSRLIGRDMIIA